MADPSHPHPSSPRPLLVPPQRALLPLSALPALAWRWSGVSLAPVSKCPSFLDYNHRLCAFLGGGREGCCRGRAQGWAGASLSSSSGALACASALDPLCAQVEPAPVGAQAPCPCRLWWKDRAGVPLLVCPPSDLGKAFPGLAVWVWGEGWHLLQLEIAQSHR